MRRPRGTLLLSAVLALVAAAPARAEVGAATTLDGPSADVLELHAAAMAEDGTGGVVYRRRADGRPHVYVARFASGRWFPPQRVDTGQRFESTWPAIGAGNGGRLVVTWAQDFGTGNDRLYSASLDPGATRFQAPVLVDINVGEANATYPSLAMNRGGQAYLAYRVVTQVGGNLPPGYVGADTRLARYNGGTWSVLGQVADRNASSPVREPSEANRPRIAIDASANGAVAFQEPDDDFVARVWARRIFGSSLGIPLQVSPGEWEGRPLLAPADQIALDMSGFGATSIAFRQSPSSSGALRGTRIMQAGLPEVFSEDAAKFSAPRIVDGAGNAVPAPAPSAPSVASRATGAFATTFSGGSSTFLTTGDDGAVKAPERLDGGGTSAIGEPEVDVAASGALVASWRLQAGNRGAVGVLERRSDGVPAGATVSSARGGPVGTLLMPGSGLGDALVVFTQGGADARQIVGATVDAPPGDFVASTPVGWVRNRRFTLRWDPAPSGITGVTYGVQVDDQTIVDGLRQPVFRLGPNVLDPGAHTVQVVATDGRGQQTSSTPDEIKIDRSGPRVRVRVKRRTVTLRISDGERGETSGVDRASLSIAWGDRKRTRRFKRAIRHRYGSSGTKRLRVSVLDQAGNRRTVRKRVRIR